MSEFEKCLGDGRIIKFEPSPEMIEKEAMSAEYDLARAEESLQRDDCKWASVQAYYSMFHSAKALVLSKGYREKSHYCLLVALRELFVQPGEMDAEIADNFEMCMDIRHEADYGLAYSPESARLALEAAKELLRIAMNILSTGK